MNHQTIAIIGLGYVGLPLALEFGKRYPTIGFDVNAKRICELKNRHDSNLQASDEDFLKAKFLRFCHEEDGIQDAQIYIIAVPTPIDTYKKPDISALLNASSLVGKFLKIGDIVIYESTTYPTCTEQNCVPVLEATSGLVYNQDFFVGYSPERINPGDRQNTLTNIVKITSGSTPAAAKQIDALYASIITAGTHLAPSIKVAEATKAIENAQRDINIALMNELAIIFERLGIDTQDVLEAARTKWNFLPFTPGLVGGHCIGVDPYYLIHIAASFGYHPKIIATGRYINDLMPAFIAQKMVKLLSKNAIPALNANILILGVTFKENCPDIRNSKIPEVRQELLDFGCNVAIYDPLADKNEVKKIYGFEMLDTPVWAEQEAGKKTSSETTKATMIEKTGKKTRYDGIILAVAHKSFETINPHELLGENGVIYDLKGFFGRKAHARL
ncbi:nucleotide sugar dehydrogenase [Helicobacter sp. 11S02596-1]|uniref:nucleotide sugar dehydrogenase n=1 Tax=Helicobacter sp. 11S02596-1 TaxID=1476194 RepID=UPI000BA5D277|nr:nucleotide sugar dehydrogenase [Helicobacter sp. 11S02596-1]PAF45206.1 Vi polysaccharide biosynthesis protein VipA/TviB [Helicobacter sp. 11S02596-1]